VQAQNVSAVCRSNKTGEVLKGNGVTFVTPKHADELILDAEGYDVFLEKEHCYLGLGNGKMAVDRQGKIWRIEREDV